MQDQDKGKDEKADKGPLGDVLPHDNEGETKTGGSLKPEDVDDRPNVGTVKPEDYPSQA